jgi:hypothetical protein
MGCQLFIHLRRHYQICDEQYPSFPIDDCENTLSFPSVETSLGSGLPSHLPKGDVPCPSIPSHGFLHHTIGTLNNATCVHAITDLKMLINSQMKLT